MMVDWKVPFSFELTLGYNVLARISEYTLCDSHVNYSQESSNKYPALRFDIRDELFDRFNKEDVDEWELESLVVNEWREQFSDEYWCKENGWKPFQDINGYWMLLDIPVYDLWLQRKEHEEEIAWLYDKINEGRYTMTECADDIKNELEEIAEIDNELFQASWKYREFEKFVEALKEKREFEEFVFVKNNEGEIERFCHQELAEEV
jgi:hypothetical protein